MQTEQPGNAERNAHAGLLVSAVIVGASFPAVGLISEALPPLSLTSLRFAIAALATWPLVRRLKPSWPGAMGFAVYGLLGLSLASFFGTMFWAAHHASALSMAAMYVGVPAMAYLLGRLLGVEPSSPRLIAILSVGAAGAFALIWAESRSHSETLSFGKGEAAFLLACVGAASYPVLSKYGLKRSWLSPHAELRSFWSLLTGCLAIGAIALLSEHPWQLVLMTPRDAVLITYLAVISSAFTFWLSQRATAVLSPGAVTAYSYTAPFFSMLLLFHADPQQLGWQWLPGSLLVILAIALLLRKDRTHRPAAASTAPCTLPRDAADAACST